MIKGIVNRIKYKAELEELDAEYNKDIDDLIDITFMEATSKRFMKFRNLLWDRRSKDIRKILERPLW